MVIESTERIIHQAKTKTDGIMIQCKVRVGGHPKRLKPLPPRDDKERNGGL